MRRDTRGYFRIVTCQRCGGESYGGIGYCVHCGHGSSAEVAARDRAHKMERALRAIKDAPSSFALTVCKDLLLQALDQISQVQRERDEVSAEAANVQRKTLDEGLAAAKEARRERDEARAAAAGARTKALKEILAIAERSRFDEVIALANTLRRLIKKKAPTS